MTDPDPQPTDVDDRPLPTRREWVELLGRVGASTLAGLVAGVLVGGVGGRLAMFVLRLTSSDAVRGVATDDGFGIGAFTLDTAVFLVFTALAGSLFAVPYLVVRRWLPERRRPLQAAAFYGLVGGAAIVEPGGVDFTFIDPLLLAVVLFVALPAGYGAAMAAGTEWLLDDPGRWRVGRYFALGPLALTGVGGVVVGVGAAISVVVGRRSPRLSAVSRGAVITTLARLLLVAGATLGLVQLLSDAGEIL